MIISFSWTSRALLAGRKSMTRRKWKAGHAARFSAGQIVDAWDGSPRRGGARKIATLRLTQDPYEEELRLAPSGDFESEGFAFLAEQKLSLAGEDPHPVWQRWLKSEERLYVVRFEVILD